MGKAAETATAPGEQPQVADPTPTEATQTIEKGAGEAYVSFDELEAVENFQKTEIKAEAEKQIEVEKVKEAIKGKDDKGESKQASAEESEKQETKKSEETTETETKASEETKEAGVKLIKAKDGDKDFEVPENLTVPVKVDGKEELVSLDELRVNYSGKTAWETKFNDLHKERKEFETKFEQVNNAIEHIQDDTKKDLFNGFLTFSEYMGFDPIQVEKQVLDQLVPHATKLSQMTDEERKIHDLELENKARDMQLKRAEKTQANKTQVDEINAEVARYEKLYNLDRQVMESTFQKLVNLQSEGELDGAIDAKLVAETAIYNRTYDNVEKAFKVVSPTHAGDEALMDEVAGMLTAREQEGRPMLSSSEIEDVVKQAFGEAKEEEVSEALSKKAADVGPKSTGGAEPGTRQPQHEDLYSFDEL